MNLNTFVYLKSITILRNWHYAKRILKKCNFNILPINTNKNLRLITYFNHYCWYSDTVQCYNLCKLLSVFMFYFCFLFLFHRVSTLSKQSISLSEKLQNRLWPLVTKMMYVEGTNSFITTTKWTKFYNLELCHFLKKHSYICKKYMKFWVLT